MFGREREKGWVKMERAARIEDCRVRCLSALQMWPSFKLTCLYFPPLSACVMIDKQGISPSYKVTPCLLSSSYICILYVTSGCKMWSEISACVHVCLDVFMRVTVRTHLRREDDSKCQSVVWGQPSQTHSSCRRCCHPPPHCLCTGCLQSPSNTWRFHPPSVTLVLCLLLRLNKLSHRPSSPGAHLCYLCSRGST